MLNKHGHKPFESKRVDIELWRSQRKSVEAQVENVCIHTTMRINIFIPVYLQINGNLRERHEKNQFLQKCGGGY